MSHRERPKVTTRRLYKVTQGSFARMFGLSMIYREGFHVRFIPSTFKFTGGSLDFDPEEQAYLFEFGYLKALEGTAWATRHAPTSNEELIQRILDSVSRFDKLQPPDWLKR